VSPEGRASGRSSRGNDLNLERWRGGVAAGAQV